MEARHKSLRQQFEQELAELDSSMDEFVGDKSELMALRAKLVEDIREQELCIRIAKLSQDAQQVTPTKYNERRAKYGEKLARLLERHLAD